MSFSHQSIALVSEKPLVYTAMSKHLFYYRMFISKFVLEAQAVPLNPFMIFDYFLLDTLDRDLVREANNNLVKKSDAIWVFGQISNGVLAEIQLAKSAAKPIRYFAIRESRHIVEVGKDEVEMEGDVKQFQNEL